MKIKKLALLLPLLPFLMANSPARSVYSGRYEDFEASYVGEEIIDNYRYQVFHVKNTGEGYISYLNVNGTAVEYDFSCTVREDDFYPIFETVVIAPNQEVDVKVKSYTALAVIDGSKLSYYSYAYTSFVEGATVSGTKNVEVLKETENYCYYSIDVQVDDATAKIANSLVFKANYDGVEFYLKVDSYQKYRFYTTEQIDLNKLEIGDPVAVLKDAEDDYYYEGLVVVGQLLLRLLLVFIAILFIVGSIIFLAIFLPKIIRKSKQRKRDQALKEKQNNEGDKRE